ncbi:MAG: hypothetical protein ACKVPY_07775 [Paracoccaceae bacterium]
MIEKYFDLGIRFKWTKPADVNPAIKDGRIVDSTRQSNLMIYDGLDTIVSPRLRMMNVSALGLTMRMPIQHAWLDYAHGQTARIAQGPYDVLTGLMSGCIITRWQDRGVTYVGHVGTITGDLTVNRQVKRTFAFAMNKTTTGFNPAGAFSDGELFDLSRIYKPVRMVVILAIVTTKGEFFAVAMLPTNSSVQPHLNTEWCAAGVKRVPPIGHDALKMQLLRD